MTAFRHKPATVVVTNRATREQEVWVGSHARFGPSDGLAAPFAVELFARGDMKIFPIGTILADSNDELELLGSEEGSQITVRAYQPEDATRAITVDSEFALPSAVVATMVNDEAGEARVTNTAPSLEALVDDNGFVSTLLLVSDAGLYARYDSQWVPLQSSDPLDGLSVYELKPEGLSLYDQYDQVGQSVHIASMPITDAEAVDRPVIMVGDTVTKAAIPDPTPAQEPAAEEAIVEEDVEVSVDPLAASAAADVPEELKAMIAAGERDPDVRWVAERRARAMNYEGPLPWEVTS